ncbi:MAG: sensor histidine kinase [Desulfomonile tiedjei]|nr:sensor histidine kinase [Desulfomonile tiedjei]
MLVHEIRNRTIAIGAFLRLVKDRFGPFQDKDIGNTYRRADDAVDSLERLADTFSPLASRAFRRRKKGAVLEERIRECRGLLRGGLRRNGINCHIPDSRTEVSVDPGELDAILINLINNAAYWLSQSPEERRSIKFSVKPMDDGRRVRLWVHDTGPGLQDDDVERVFWPGVTRKPGGIGMGLTVASELVQEYGGRMFVKHPGTMGGASFACDLPLKR